MDVFVCCLTHEGSTGVSLLLQILNGVILQVMPENVLTVEFHGMFRQ